MRDPATLLRLTTLVLVAAAAIIVIVFLARQPVLGAAAKVWLFLGVGALPIAAAVTGNVAGAEASKQRDFCGSCHIMEGHARDAAEPASSSLASRHSRNAEFGGQSCYTCHKNYKPFGGLTTKVNGLRHVRAYYFDANRRTAHAEPNVRLYVPYSNDACTRCHSTKLVKFWDEPEHSNVKADLIAGSLSCATKSCHGPAHSGVSPAASNVGIGQPGGAS